MEEVEAVVETEYRCEGCCEERLVDTSCSTDCNDIVLSTQRFLEFGGFCSGETVAGATYVGSCSVGEVEVREGGEDVEHFCCVTATTKDDQEVRRGDRGRWAACRVWTGED